MSDELECILERGGLYQDITSICINFAKRKAESRERHVIDVVDPFSLFEGLSWKRYNIYKRLNYNVKRMKVEEFLNIKSTKVIKPNPSPKLEGFF